MAAHPEYPVPRRLVTAIDEEGKSYFAEDEIAKNVITVDERPGYKNINIWRVLGRIDEPDTIGDQSGVAPPAGGVVIRVVDVPPLPADRKAAREQARATFSKMFPDAVHDAESTRSPNMHATSTVDFAVVLEGEIFAVMDKGERLMRRGDILIQRGTNHAWENRSSKTARMLFVLCDAEDDDHD